MSEFEFVVLPVVVYHGGCEEDVGSIKIHQTLGFKQLQNTLKEAMGVSHYNNNINLTTFLVVSNRSKSPAKRLKVLVTGHVNLFALARERKCYLRVVLKQSQKRNSKNQNVLFAPPVSPQCMILHRQMHPYRGVCYVPMMKVGFFKAVSYPPVLRVQEFGWRSRALCKDCAAAEKEGGEATFHSCVYDQVVAGTFRSTAGPISRLR